MPAPDFEVLVVGSGASGVHSAWPLAEAGVRVGMLDVGNQERHYEPLIPSKSFLEIRRSDPEQHRYFLGDRFEGISLGKVGLGAQLTPPRRYVTSGVEAQGPLDAGDIRIMQSLALGGLGAAWGASAVPFSDDDMAGWPMTRRELQPHYDAVANRIGVSGEMEEDLEPYVGPVDGLLPAAELDSNGESIYLRYRQRRAALRRAGFALGKAWIAAATERLGDRGPLQYYDMEFWADKDRAIYRPRYTVEKLREFPNFQYHEQVAVERFEQDASADLVRVSCAHLPSGRCEQFTTRRLILAAGAIATARIVLRSLQRFDCPVPFATNPYTYYPSLNFARLGRPTRDRRHSLTQLLMFFDPDMTRRRILQLQLYSYRSLLLFKLAKESPLAFPQSLRIMRELQEYFVIIGIHHEDRPGPGQWLKLLPGAAGGDVLQARYEAPAGVESDRLLQERRAMRCLRQLGCLAIKAVRPGCGSSIHYGGTFPMAGDGGPLTTHPSGYLRAAPLVYLGDGSTFPHLPAKGITFTLMANGNRVGTAVRDAVLASRTSGVHG